MTTKTAQYTWSQGTFLDLLHTAYSADLRRYTVTQFKDGNQSIEILTSNQRAEPPPSPSGATCRPL